MLEVTRNIVVQQHLPVVQQLEQLSPVVLSYYYHRTNLGEADTKKPSVLREGFEPTTCRLCVVDNAVEFKRLANLLSGSQIPIEILGGRVAERVL